MNETTQPIQEIQTIEVSGRYGEKGWIVPPGYKYIEIEPKKGFYNEQQTFNKLNEFSAYCQEFKKDNSRIIPADDSFVCDFNYHAADQANEMADDHTAKFVLRSDPDFVRWQKHAGKPMAQKEFADFMADYAKDFHFEINSQMGKADILEIAKRIKVVSESTMNSDYENGGLDVLFSSKESATFGNKPIPEVFEIGLPVYHGFQAYVMPIRVFWKKDGGQVFLRFEFVRLHLITDRAYEDAAKLVSLQSGVPVYGYEAKQTLTYQVTPNEGV